MFGNQNLADDLANVICLTFDVDWARAEVLDDILRVLDDARLRATFFCTHEAIEVPGHERALHPNFRWTGDTLRRMYAEHGATRSETADLHVYRYVIESTQAFCPEAVGVRAHSLFYDSRLLLPYHAAGLEYDSSYCLPFAPSLGPVYREHGILELPIYYMDHLDLMTRATGFRVEALKLDQAGMKVFDFHPNMIFANVPTEKQYEDSKNYHADVEKLRKVRHPGRGIGTLFLDLIEHIVGRRLPTMTLAEVNAAWRAGQKRDVTQVCDEPLGRRPVREDRTVLNCEP